MRIGWESGGCTAWRRGGSGIPVAFQSLKRTWRKEGEQVFTWADNKWRWKNGYIDWRRKLDYMLGENSLLRV